MNGIGNITARILEKAKNESNEILRRADADAEAAFQDAKAASDARAADIRLEGSKAAEQRVKRMIGVANLEAKSRLLAERQALLNQAAELALQTLCQRSDAVSVMAAMAAGAIRSGSEELIVPVGAAWGQKLADAINKAVDGANIQLSAQQRPMQGGFVLRDGAVETSFVFEALVERAREMHAAEIASVLFETP